MRGLRSKYSPFSWSKRQIKVALTIFYMIAVPVFIIIGLQPAKAVDAENLPTLHIPAIGLTTPVEKSTITNSELSVPDRIAGSYSMYPSKTLLIGHSATVFQNLKHLKIGDEITYDQKTYLVTEITEQLKSTISMKEILASASQPTIIIMTCSGQPLSQNDYTHRLIITAQ